MLTFPGFATYADVIWHRAERDPDATAFVFLHDDGTETAVTYAELYRASRGVAAAVAERVQSPDEPVLLLLPPGLPYVSGLFGCLLAGVPAVPAFPPDPYRLDRSIARIGRILRDSTAHVVLTTDLVAGACGDLIRDAAGDLGLEMLSTDAVAPSDEAPAAAPDPSAPAVLQYTSGSTTLPRGVVVTQGNLAANCEWIRRAFEIGERSGGVSWLPPYHDMGLVGGILEPVYACVPMASMSPLRFLRQPVDWLRALTRFGADISGGPNFAYELCARRVKPQELAELDLSRWKVAFTGAELVRPETLEAFAARFAPAGFEPTAFYPCYGLAEATLLVSGGTRAQRPRVLSVTRDTLAREGRAVPAQGDEARALVSVGAAGPEHEVAIVDPAQRRERPPSEVGEIWVRGPSVTEGYWRREDDTAEVFAAFTADERGPYLRTGDLGFVCDGELYVTGRIKDVIVVNGRNIYPTDVERACERAVEGLRAGCGAAFGVSSASGEERVAVVYEVRDAEDAGLAATLERLRRAVAMEVSMEPEAVVLVQPRSIPKTSSGKVQRWLVREHFLEERFDVVAAWRASR